MAPTVAELENGLVKAIVITYFKIGVQSRGKDRFFLFYKTIIIFSILRKLFAFRADKTFPLFVQKWGNLK